MFIQIISINLYLPVFFPSLPSVWGPVIPSHQVFGSLGFGNLQTYPPRKKTLKKIAPKTPGCAANRPIFSTQKWFSRTRSAYCASLRCSPPTFFGTRMERPPWEKTANGVCLVNGGTWHDVFWWWSRGGLLLKASHQKKTMMDPWDEDVYLPTLASLTQPMDPEKKV